MGSVDMLEFEIPDAGEHQITIKLAATGEIGVFKSYMIILSQINCSNLKWRNKEDTVIWSGE